MTINFNDVTDTATPTSGTFNTGGNANIRGSGTNFVTYSQQIGGTNWINSSTTSTLNDTTAPDNTLTATSLIETATTAQHFVSQGITFLANTNICVSAYVKFPLTTRAFELQATDAPSGGSSYAAIDVSYLGVAQTPTVSGSFTGITGSSTSVGNGWYRVQMSFKTGPIGIITVRLFLLTNAYVQSYAGDGTSNIFVWGSQVEFGLTANNYIPTTTPAIYGTPTLSLSGVGGLGLQSDGSLYVNPVGTGALQAQPTTSTAVGGNARGTNAVDWQMSRNAATQIASTFSVISGGSGNTSNGYASTTVGGESNTNSAYNGFIGAGSLNALGSNAQRSVVVGGVSNTANGYINFIGGGALNSGTSGVAVTTQSATMNGTTAVTLSGSNANIRVGQLIQGTSIQLFPYTYVAAISGTSLTLSQNATGSTTNTLSFFAPHGIVVGGGNNQATGSYSFIGGGGNAGDVNQRNLAAADWSSVVGGRNNQISANANSGTGFHFIGGGDGNAITTANAHAFIGAGSGNLCTSSRTVICGGQSHTASGINSAIGGGTGNTTSGVLSAISGGSYGTTRSIAGNAVFPACANPIASVTGVSQAALLVLARETTNATATVLASDSSAAGGNNQVILPNNSAYFFKGSVIANVTGAASGAAWSFEGAIMRGANAASTVLIGTPVLNRIAVSSGASLWAVALTADTTNGGLAVTVTGIASTTIRWVAKLETTEVTY